jgi:hypothetical protein
MDRPSQVSPAADDAANPGSATDVSTPTRADRIRRRISDNKIGAVIVVAVGLLSAVGGTIGGVRQIAGLFDSSSKPTATSAVRLNPSELRTAKNSRYGFSFQYPVTWERQDPVNGDGLAAAGPEPGLALVAYGSLPVEGPSPDDVFSRLEYQVQQLADGNGARIVEAPNQQNVTRFLSGGETTEMAGYRFVMETDAAEGVPALTTVALVTTTRERDVEMLCKVPTGLAPRWRGACNQFLASLTLTR